MALFHDWMLALASMHLDYGMNISSCYMLTLFHFEDQVRD